MTKNHVYECALDYPDPSAFVVDDEPQVRAFVSSVLATSGFKPSQFSTSGEVETALADTVPQVIILDLSLGDSDAIEVIRILAMQRFQGDVLVISGHDATTMEEVHKIGERRGINMIEPLRKPFRIEQLRARLDAVRRDVPARFDASLDAALGSFVTGCAHDATRRAMCEAVVDLARLLTSRAVNPLPQ